MRAHCPVCDAGLDTGRTSWLLRCRRCGLERSSLREQIADARSRAVIDEAGRAEALSALRERNFRTIVGLLGNLREQRGRLLDVGCAHGWFLREAASSGWTAVGIEPDPDVARLASRNGTVVRNGTFPGALKPDDRFDVITFNDVFEHLADVNAALRACDAALCLASFDLFHRSAAAPTGREAWLSLRVQRAAAQRRLERFVVAAAVRPAHFPGRVGFGMDGDLCAPVGLARAPVRHLAGDLREGACGAGRAVRFARTTCAGAHLSDAAAVPSARASAGVPFGLALLALLLPVRSASQAIFAGSFALALTSMGLWGLLFARWVLRLPRLGPWTAVYLGQFALLAAAAPVLAVNHLAAATLGKSLPLVALVGPATLVLAFREIRSLRAYARVDLLALLGLGSVALVVAVYSSHLSALGLDIHEHTVWLRPIVSSGFVPFDEGGTRILGEYPHTFHLLTALWNAAGLAAPAGPFAKAMPFLQSALPALALAEQVVDAQAARAPADRRKWEIALGVAFYVYVFLLVPVVYPVTDLLGTPRFSSGGLLLLPVVLVVIAQAQQAPRASLLAVATAPLLAAWAISWHPVIALFLPAATLPLLVALWVALRPPRVAQGSGRAHVATLAVSAALGVLVLAQDPWVAQMAGDRIPACRKLLERAGLVSFDEAVRRGLATARDKAVHETAADPPCRDAPCVLRAAGAAAGDALAVPLASARTAIADLTWLSSPSLPGLRDAFKNAVPLRYARLADYAGGPFVIFIFAGALAWAWFRLRGRWRDAPQSRPFGALLPASLVGIAAAGIGLAFIGELAGALHDRRHESIVIAAYLLGAGQPVSVSFLWLPFMASAVVLVEPLIARARPRSEHPSASRPARVRAAAGLALWLALPLAARLNLHWPLQHRGFWTPIAFADLRSLRAVEEAIPPGDGVIIPAEHMELKDWEHWVIPVGDTAALLTYGERRYLFNVYLGASYPLSWRDLVERLCSRDPAVRSRFLERTRARWVLVRDLDARNAEEAVQRPQPRMCGVSFAALGAELPAVRQERGIFLFRLSESGTDRTAR